MGHTLTNPRRGRDTAKRCAAAARLVLGEHDRAKVPAVLVEVSVYSIGDKKPKTLVLY